MHSDIGPFQAVLLARKVSTQGELKINEAHLNAYLRTVTQIIPITDNPEANIIRYFPESTAFIEQAIKENHNILVLYNNLCKHCIKFKL